MSVLGKIVGQIESGGSSSQVPHLSVENSDMGVSHILLCKKAEGAFFKGIIVFENDHRGSMIDIVVNGEYVYGSIKPKEISLSGITLSVLSGKYNDEEYIILKVHCTAPDSGKWYISGAQSSDPSIVQWIPENQQPPTELSEMTFVDLLEA